METEQIQEKLFKVRSYASCLQKGSALYAKNFKLIFKWQWIPALIFAFVTAVFVTMNGDIQQLGSSNGSIGDIVALLPQLIIVIVLLLVAEALVYGFMFTLFRKYATLGYLPATTHKSLKKELKHNVWRVIKLTLWLILYIVVVTVAVTLIFSIPVALTHKPGIISTMLLVVLGIAFYLFFLVSLFYIGFKYLMEDGHFVTTFNKTYATTIRHWGKIFVLLLLACIITMICSLIGSLPMAIVSIAKVMSNKAILDGDPSGLPSSFGAITFVISIICSFISVFIGMYLYFPVLFLYGSIEQEEKERNEMKLQATQDNEEKDEEIIIH